MICGLEDPLGALVCVVVLEGPAITWSDDCDIGDCGVWLERDMGCYCSKKISLCCNGNNTSSLENKGAKLKTTGLVTFLESIWFVLVVCVPVLF